MSLPLLNKKILFICPIFHNYHAAITEKLQEMGATVLFFPEREYGLSFKLINNFAHSRLAAFQAKHYHKILKSVENEEIDYLFVIRGYMLPQEFMEGFRKNHPGAITIMYQWDSNRTNPFVHLIPAFDRVLSFDFEDCEVNKSVDYLPLFYTDDITHFINRSSVKEYDFFFMGWFFPERYAAVVEFKKYCELNNYRLKAFLFIPSTSYLKEQLKGRKLDRTIVSKERMSRQEYLQILNASRVMVDVSNPGQTGLAMRIIESFACGTKVLTNNRRLENDSFYTPGYVDFFDDKAPSVNREFVENAVESAKPGVLSIKEWLNLIFANQEKNCV
ncbi:glycosyltransferase family protein [Chitinophaga arvensicola]|uniref:Spore protein YkvP/CgeB glycosyl transferase-like domain-containing protein n=1 Tax=Chitinophaga arvensicola TaxID=29529 RepID=A0A1I0NP78_9BACT|nr:hypothetical protein [Chitinophaga arvensicola]SEW03269.1 hypothetical protein SAMN04488122_0295 [Chitinophaga arvensicola]